MPEKDSIKQEVIDLVDDLNDLNIFPWVDYSSPRQFELFWMDSPLECQYLVLTHDSNREDDRVIINGPCCGSEFLEELKNTLLKPRWQQSVDDYMIPRVDAATSTSVDVSTRKDAVINIFQGVEQQLGGEVFKERKTRLKEAHRVEDDNWLFFFRDSIFELDSAEELMKNTLGDIPPHLKEEKSEEEKSEKENEEEESEEPILHPEGNALGTYMFEPVWVGGAPELDFRDRILINPPKEYDTVYSTQIGEYKVIITKDGFIGINELENESTVLDILNTIFGTSVLLEHPFEAATRDDLIEIIIDEDNDVSDRLGNPSLRRRPASPEPLMVLDRHQQRRLPIERESIGIDYIDRLCSVSKKVYQNEKMKERVNSTLQAHTHHVNGEYTQAFLLAWISIEQYINTALDEYLKEMKDVNSDRRRNLQRGGHWGASHLIELMQISGCITSDMYVRINKFRKKRNEIVHNTESASMEESKEIVNLSFKLIDEQLPVKDEKREYI